MRSFFLTCFFIVWVFFISACTGTSGPADIITPAKKVIERQIGDRVNGISFQQIDPVNGKETFEIEIDKDALQIVDEEGKRYIDSDEFSVYIGTSQPDRRSERLLKRKPLELRFNIE